MNNIILASASPRRLTLLKQIGIFVDKVCPADIDETPLLNEEPQKYAVRMAEMKAQKIAPLYPECFVLAADTVVACGRRILPKAQTYEQAAYCLNLLSGRRHSVYGGICLITPSGDKKIKSVKTVVAFSRLHDTEKKAYLDGTDWQGKAGGYAIQGKAALFVRKIIGSYSNVVGLGLYETAALLKSCGILGSAF